MLIGQHSGGHKHCHLFAIYSGLESGTHGHLGLTESHIATHQSVHGARTLHIGLDILRGLKLVGGVLVEERCLEFVLQI